MTAKRRKKLLGKAGLYTGLTAITLLLIFPFIWMVSTSLKNKNEMFSATPTLLPKHVTLENYYSMWFDYNFGVYLKNSLIAAVSTTLISLLVATFLAYGISRFRFRGKTVVFNLLILTQMFPLPLLIITIYVVFARIGLIDSRAGLIISYCTFAIPFATMMLKSYFDGLPLELEEAAAMDGCGPFATIFRVVIPLSAPSVAAMGLFSFILAWQEFMMSLTLIRSPQLRTLPVGITLMVGFRDIMWGPLMAGTVVVTLPVVVLFIYFQKYLITGMTMGAVKG
ncbi:MAG TPA: carbohydrate ABC transporter permease [Candidatus Ruthenibacterium merdigallinarum]|nr:carbohydrate ABC transporter permease [Candidatus Ruthenibacterium merdigallinarum]